jgi:hypothetical protein
MRFTILILLIATLSGLTLAKDKKNPSPKGGKYAPDCGGAPLCRREEAMAHIKYLKAKAAVPTAEVVEEERRE